MAHALWAISEPFRVVELALAKQSPWAGCSLGDNGRRRRCLPGAQHGAPGTVPGLPWWVALIPPSYLKSAAWVRRGLQNVSLIFTYDIVIKYHPSISNPCWFTCNFERKLCSWDTHKIRSPFRCCWDFYHSIERWIIFLEKYLEVCSLRCSEIGTAYCFENYDS